MRVKKENLNAHMYAAFWRMKNSNMRKECLEEISDQQSNASKACTGRNTHRVRGTGELGAAR
jgi:hypothetical protein